MNASLRFYRQLVTALPAQGFRQWFYDADEKKLGSWPLLGWAVFREKAERHECDEDYCACDGDESAIVVGLSADGEGGVDEVGDRPDLIGVLPEGQAFTLEEAADIHHRNQRVQDARLARANVRSQAK